MHTIFYSRQVFAQHDWNDMGSDFYGKICIFITRVLQETRNDLIILTLCFQDNPSDYNYFFDTSRRRTCYIAPERFVESSTKSSEQEQSSIDLTTSEVKKGDLTPAMDIFSAG